MHEHVIVGESHEAPAIMRELRLRREFYGSLGEAVYEAHFHYFLASRPIPPYIVRSKIDLVDALQEGIMVLRNVRLDPEDYIVTFKPLCSMRAGSSTQELLPVLRTWQQARGVFSKQPVASLGDERIRRVCQECRDNPQELVQGIKLCKDEEDCL